MSIIWDTLVERNRDTRTGRFARIASRLAASSRGGRTRRRAVFRRQAARRDGADVSFAAGQGTRTATAGGAVGAAIARARPALAKTRSLRELEAVATAEVARIRGPGGRRVKFVFETRSSDPRIPGAERQCALKTAQEHVEGILRGLERFPHVNVEYVSIAHSATDEQAQNAYAYTLWGNRVFFNLHFSSTPGRRRYLTSLRNDVGSGWHPPNTASPIAVALHEFAHILDMDALDEAVHFLANRLYAEAIQPGPGKPVTLWERASGGISSYAKTNAHELIAEAFADYMVNGDEAAQLSKAIFELLEGEYQARQRKAA